MTELSTLRWENYPGSSGDPNVITRVLARGMEENSELRGICNVETETKIGEMHLENAGRGH